MRRQVKLIANLVTGLITVAGVGGLSIGQEPRVKVTFDDDVKLIFQQRCATCHNSEKQSAGLDLSNYTNMMQGGGSGQSIEPGDASGSFLYMLITHSETPVMPPDGTKIPENNIKTIESWINSGALENKGSVARPKKKVSAASITSIGKRPEIVATLPRMTLEPFFYTARPGVATAIATSPWTPTTAVAAPRQILLFDTRNSDLIGTLPFPEGQANVLRFSRNGELLIAGGGRHGLAGKVVIWNVASADRIIDIGNEIDNVLAADISADHSRVALGGPQKMLRVFSTTDAELLFEVKKHTDWITAIEFSPDGVLLASADRNGGLHVWESQTGNEYLTLGGHAKPITQLSWRSDGNVLASAGDDGAIRLWEMERGSQIKAWTAHGQAVNGINFTRDGKIVSTGRDSLVKLWQQDGKLIRQFDGLDEMGVAVAFCDEANTIIASSFSGVIAAWNAADGKRVNNFPINPLPLSDRLNQSTTQLAIAQTKLAPIAERMRETEKQLNQVQLRIDEQTLIRDQFAAELKDVRQQLASIKNQLESSAASRTGWQKELEETEQAIPLVAEAIKSASAASNLLPLDQDLKASSEQLAKHQQKLKDRLVDLAHQISDSQQNSESQTTQMSQLDKLLTEAESKSGAAAKRLAQLTREIQPIQQQKQDLTKQVEVAKADVNKFQTAAKHWQEEIAFHNQLKAKLEELEIAQSLIDSKNDELEQAKKNLNQAQAEFQAKMSAKQESETAAAKIEAELMKLKTPK